jgi:hypothetical protein
MSASATGRRRHVVIVGCGGLSAVKTLGRAAVDITVIDRTNHHLVQPLLHQGLLQVTAFAPPQMPRAPRPRSDARPPLWVVLPPSPASVSHRGSNRLRSAAASPSRSGELHAKVVVPKPRSGAAERYRPGLAKADNLP